MKFDKSRIIDLIKSRGDHEQAKQAESELPAKVDTDQDQGLLNKFGIDVGELAGKLPGQFPGLGGLGA